MNQAYFTPNAYNRKHSNECNKLNLHKPNQLASCIRPLENNFAWITKIHILLLLAILTGTFHMQAQCTNITGNNIIGTKPVDNNCINWTARDAITLSPGFSTLYASDKRVSFVWDLTDKKGFTPTMTIYSITATGIPLQDGYDNMALSNSLSNLQQNLLTLLKDERGLSITMFTWRSMDVEMGSDFTYSGNYTSSTIKNNETTNSTFSAKIDHTVVAPQTLTYSTPVDGTTRILDKTNFIPGTIGGNIDISRIGAVSYQLPIQVSPGTMGMQPNLSIVYSSQSGNDDLGLGWHLSGLSAITRASKNPYYNGTYAPVTCTNITAGGVGDDVLMLDGQRLIRKDTYTYSPENEPYTTIVYDGSKFTVTTKDGMVMEFGNNYNNNNSRFTATGSTTPYAWGIDKISDPNGNYIEFIYTANTTTSEYHISTINYTGNSISGAKPYNSVYFYYDKRSDSNTDYIAGGSVNSSQLLSNIKVFAEGTLSKDYTFTYVNDDVYSKLNQISLTADGVTYNPTIVNWGTTANYTPQITNAGLGSLFANQLLFGDFNGDGKTDYATYDKNKTITVYMNGGTSYTINLPHDENISSTSNGIYSYRYNVYNKFDISITDINNDGKDDLMVHCPNHNNTTQVQIVATGQYLVNSISITDEITEYLFTGSGFTNSSPISSSVLNRTHYFVDFNNDGITDHLAIDNKSLTAYLGMSGSAIPITTNVTDIKLLDFDGDGQAEILVLTDNGYGSIWKYSGDAFTKLYGDGTSTFFGKPNDVFIGDFNGDGLSDCLTIEGVYGWYILFNTGNGFSKKDLPSNMVYNTNYPCSNTGLINTSDGKFWPAIGMAVEDLNNDGKSDIVFASVGTVTVAISTGMSFKVIPPVTVSSVNRYDMSNIKLYTADLNNDGQKEVIYGVDDMHYTSLPVVVGYTPYTSVHEAYKKLSFPLLYTGQYVSSITDGSNINLSVTYGQTNTYSAGVRNYPVIPVKGSIYLPSLIIRKDLNTNTELNHISYTFQDALVHAQGGGFLGFTTVSSLDDITKDFTSVTYKNTISDGAGNTCFYPWPYTQTTKRGNISISTVTNSMTAYEEKTGDMANRLFSPIMNTSVTTNNLKGFSITNSVVTFDATRGRITDQKSVTSDGWSIETNSTYETVSGNISKLSQNAGTRTLGTDSYTFATIYSYDPTFPLRLTSQTFQGNITTDYTSFDDYGNITGITVSATDGSTPRSTSNIYDGFGRFVIRATDVTGLTSTITYRPTDGAILSKTDPNSNITTYNYSSSGNSVYSTATLPDGNISTTTVAWDDTDTGLTKTVKSITNGSTVTAYVNAAGLKLKETTNSGLNGAVFTKTYTYNTDGTLNTSTDPAGNITTTQYYPEGRVKSIVGLNLNNSYTYTDNATTVTNNIVGQNGTTTTQTTTSDALGNVTQVTGTSGQIDYAYFASGKVHTITTGGSTTTMEYDPATLAQTKLIDPNVGTTTYDYTGFGELYHQTDAAGIKTTFGYDDYGRLLTKSNPTTITTNGNVPATSYSYEYYTDAGVNGLLKKVTRDNITETYTYDGLSRLKSKTTTTDLWPDNTPIPAETYSYNGYGQLATKTLPTGLNLNYVYDNVGNLIQINDANNKNIWTGDTQNSLGQWTQFTLNNADQGNVPLITRWGYDANYRLNSIKTGTISDGTSIQNLGFTFNTAGQLTNRTEGSLSENFNYDALNRLTSQQVGTGNTYSTNYLSNGNINNTSLTGAYSYLAGHPHAVDNVAVSANSGQSAAIGTTSTYTAENKVLLIENNNFRDDFAYGVDGNRFRVDYLDKIKGTKFTKIYLGSCEFGYDASGLLIYKRTIVNAPTGVCAIYQDSGNIQAFYYIHTDYLGSWLTITDNTGSLKNRYSYDAWGRPRNPDTWELKPIGIANALVDLNDMQPRFDRGYTGHEVMAGVGLINMNGRLYDPYLQRFLSPDILVQAPGNSQSYNRYSYCLNNPFAYTDPSGYSWWSHFWGYVGERFDKLGAWMTKNKISFQVGYSTSIGGPIMRGTPYLGGTFNGKNLSIGYTIDYGRVGIGTNNGEFTNFYYPTECYNKSVETALRNIEDVRTAHLTNNEEHWWNKKLYGVKPGGSGSSSPESEARVEKFIRLSSPVILLAMDPIINFKFEGEGAIAREEEEIIFLTEARANAPIGGLTFTANTGARVFTETAREGDLIFYSTKIGEDAIEFGGNISKSDGILTIRNFDIDGALTNKVGISGIKNIITDFGKQQGVRQVIIEGAKRTTGANPGRIPSSLIFNIE